MGGTKSGGLKAAIANTINNPNHYKEIGAMGGKKGHTGGFFVNRELASFVGRLGGTISRRGDKKTTDKERARMRKQFERNYKHLIAIQQKANKERQKRTLTEA